MRLTLSNTGSYPRIGDTKEQQRLRTAHARLDKGGISKADFEKIQDQVTLEAIREQEKAGLDIVTDGQIRWGDPVSYIAGRLSGASINGLLRFFDTNFYFRQPVVKGKIRRKGPIVAAEWERARRTARKPVKPVLMGPYTLARLSIVQTDRYRRLAALVADYTSAISEEVAALSQAGATLIQIDEPAILRNRQDFPLLKEAIEAIARKKGKAKLALYTYFGDAAPLYTRFQSLHGVDLLGLDFTYSPLLAGQIASEGSEKELGLGVIDGRNTRMETAEEVRRVLDRIAGKISQAHLGPSCGLEYLPRERAFEKLANMAKITRSS